jgi:isoleucyl-tRNA synthetase
VSEGADEQVFKEIQGARRQQDLEERALERWKATKLFQRSLARRKGAPRFTFYEGPPTANGRPGIHHVLSRTLKDAICRYRDLAGCAVERKAGWDTHGLPVEVEVEKELKLAGKQAIVEYGIEAFTRRCIESVFRYTSEWEKLTGRIGFWLDLDAAYVTFHEPYVESAWWALKRLFEDGLLYRGHKVVWWWPQGGTALSAAEVGQGYKTVDDPSVVVRFRAKKPAKNGMPRSFLSWTTTPWTLPSNVALAVAPDLEYAEVLLEATETHPLREVVVLGAGRVDATLGARPREVLRTVRGSELVGESYDPPFFFAKPEGGRHWEVVPADFVTFDTGTGLVHVAPAFGEDDFRCAKAQGLGFLQLVEPDGSMAAAVVPAAGMFVKKADPVLVKDLKARGLLFDQGTIRHEYPFCWRKPEDPLIQFARQSWFIKTTAKKDDLIALNETIDWHPEHIKAGRFGDFLRNNVDWAVSRERFWGTPLPVWINDQTQKLEVVGSIAEILEKNPRAFEDFDAARAEDPALSPHLRVHKPWIDRVTWTKPGEPGVYRRVPEVIDCWFDSGAMPFAQRHYPFENESLFEQTFPADFICEGVDQTRGWFYSLHALGTLLFGKTAYRHVVVNGHINDKQGRKMSKSLGNTVDPWKVIDEHGADPLRWYLLAGSSPWLPKSFDPDAVAEVSRKVFGTLWPSYNFFALYAGVDRFVPGGKAPPPAARPLLDRWLLSRVQSTLAGYHAAFEAYDPQRAARLLGDLIDELSNWYIRRNRARFWKSTDQDDKAAAYDTLYRALEAVAAMLGPIAPFSADELWVALHPDGRGADSIFMTDLPKPDPSLVDRGLEDRMAAALAVVSLGRAARTKASLKVRQPLARMIVSASTPERLAALKDAGLRAEIEDELNVKEVVVVEKRVGYADVMLKPNLPVLGPKLGKKLGAAREALKSVDQAAVSELESGNPITITIAGDRVTLGPDEVLVECTGKPGYAVAAERGTFVALDTRIDEALELEGLAREALSRLQNVRKDRGLAVTDRIHVRAHAEGALRTALDRHAAMLKSEALISSLELVDAPPPGAEAIDVDGAALHVAVEKAP